MTSHSHCSMSGACLQCALELPAQLLNLQLGSNDAGGVGDAGRGNAACLLQRPQLVQLLLEGRHLSILLLIRQAAHA